MWHLQVHRWAATEIYRVPLVGWLNPSQERLRAERRLLLSTTYLPTREGLPCFDSVSFPPLYAPSGGGSGGLRSPFGQYYRLGSHRDFS